MAEMKFTPSQLDAIEAKGGTVVVSAAAGSGKTSVLVERLIRRIADQNEQAGADSFVVVTFSKAAAAELKSRLAARLRTLIAENPASSFLRRQEFLLAQAKIGTIASFCLDLIKQNFDVLGLPPAFRIIDEAEAGLMIETELSSILEKKYKNGPDDFFALMEHFSSGRDDRPFIKAVVSLYGFVRSYPFYDEWLQSKVDMYDAAHPQDTVWAKVILSYARQALGAARAKMQSALELMEGDEPMCEAYWGSFYSLFAALDRAFEASDENSWQITAQAVCGIEPERLKPLRQYENVYKKDAVTDLRTASIKIVNDLKDCYFRHSVEDFADDIKALKPLMQTMAELVLELDRALAATKLRRSALGFDDLEHLALRLLVAKGEDGSYIKTPLAQGLSERYTEILVDESQDINNAQDMIFTALSRGGTNLFMVGDIKQSIYRFRQAKPEIMIKKREECFDYGSGQFPARIFLGENFRSRSSVTAAVNQVFSAVMGETVGEIKYDDKEALKPSAAYAENGRAGSFLHFLETDSASADAIGEEAEYIAAHIKSLIDSRFEVEEKGEKRPARAGDFAILLRSSKNKSKEFYNAIKKAGLNAATEEAGFFISTVEISLALSILRAVDNPLLDIPLSAAMMSPVFGFSADDMAEIRLALAKGPVYLALRAYHEKTGDTKCARFLGFLEDFRLKAAYMPVDRLIIELYRETMLCQIMRLGDASGQRQDNLNLLIDYAAGYESAGYKGLSRFIEHIDAIESRQSDLRGAVNMPDYADSVKIMTIHRSKGLEFPVVIIPDCSKKFNRMDLAGNALIHSELGFASYRSEKGGLHSFSTLPREAIKLEIERANLSEELRVLYVAMTRAKERLDIIVRCESTTELAYKHSQPQPPNPFTVRSAQSYAHWLAMSFCGESYGEFLLACKNRGGRAGKIDIIVARAGGRSMTESGAGTDLLQDAMALPESGPQADTALVEEIKKRIAFEYRFASDTLTPAKMAVSKAAGEEGQGDYRFSRRPRFMSAGGGLKGADRGNAIHKFMQFCDYQSAKASAEGEIARLRDKRFILPEEAEAVDPAAVVRFFSSALAKDIFEATEVYRELSFLAVADQEMLSAVPGVKAGINTVVQGIADCVFIKDGKAYIVDYKSDRVKRAGELAERYKNQLALYKYILGKSLGFEIGGCVIYSFHLSEAVWL